MFDLGKEQQNIENYQVLKYLAITKNKIEEYDNIVVLISGGSDSDTMIDMFTKFDQNKKIKYVFFDTGLEYQATKEHLNYLENKYDIKIDKIKAVKPIPISIKEYGVPLFNKYFSEMISRLQKHNFKWEDKSFEELYKEYPNCKCALNWWCNQNPKGSQFNIESRKYLKEFIVQNPIDFKVSNKCCKYAKKDVGKQFNKENQTDLNVVGVRKAEGGIRATAYKNCFSKYDDKYDEYRPLFFFNSEDKEYYKKYFDIKYSDCYEVWGMKRTGCVGCPYGRNIKAELEVCKKYEPKLYNACMNIFGEAYSYREAYNEFKNKRKEFLKTNLDCQTNLFEEGK